MDKKQKFLNNKGFSLVELIIVIAIMAILAGALAPQLMRYIEKSRISTDANNTDALKSAVEATLADEAAFEAIATTGLTITIINGAAPTEDAYDTAAAFKTEFEKTIKVWPKVKTTNMTKFTIVIAPDKNVTVTVN